MARKRDAKRSRATGSDYQTPNKDRLFSEAEAEFLAAIAAFRVRHGRVPTLVEGMRIAISLGYRK